MSGGEPAASYCNHSAEAAVARGLELKDDSAVVHADPQTPDSKEMYNHEPGHPHKDTRTYIDTSGSCN